MKQLFLLILLILLTGTLSAQENIDHKTQQVDSLPISFYGSTAEEINNCFLSQMRYPEELLNKNIGGTVRCRFIISKTGNCSDYTLMESVHPELDKEALRLAKRLSFGWKPAMYQGKVVEYTFVLPIYFNPEKYKKYKEETDKLFVNYEEMPSFPGGLKACLQFISRNINTDLLRNLPDFLSEDKYRVICQFTIDSLGVIRNPRIARSCHESLDKEAIRLIRLMPKWNPGKLHGIPTSIRYTMPVTFNRRQLCDTVYQVADKMPEYPGGMKELLQFISKRTRFYWHTNNIPGECGVSGRTICSFIINKEGEISNLKIERPIDPYLDRQALRILTEMPEWIPGEENGEKVCVKYTVPVSWRIYY